ncbi:MAG: GreA/GreB family elongation factor [bacterium]|nr:GreA/GreB family elongation factor [bacterium]
MVKKILKVDLGKIVLVKLTQESEVKIYKIYLGFPDLLSGKSQNKLALDAFYVSPAAPLAQAILNHTQGEKIEYPSPSGKISVEILKIF